MEIIAKKSEKGVNVMADPGKLKRNLKEINSMGTNY
jgi:hypothetical protein